MIQGGNRSYLRGIWVLSGNQAGWLVRRPDEGLLAPLIGVLPAPANNENNELWCRQALTVRDIGELRTMVEVKAFELWASRVDRGQDGTPLDDWLAAKGALGIPTCAPV